MKQEHDLTEGNVRKVLLTFSLPFLIANLIQALYGAVDLMVVGWFCQPESVAAVSTGTQVTQIITSMISGLTLGGTILVGNYVGRKDEEEAKKAIGTILTLFAVFSLILTVLMLIFSDTILSLLKTPAPSYERAKEYVTICSLGIFFICGYNAISAVLRGYGDSKRPMMFITLSCVLNIAGDIVFTGCLHMDAAGTALATILSQGISMLCAVIYLNKSQFLFRFALKNFRVEKKKALEIARLGIPISLQECMVRLSFLYLTSVTNRLGVYTAAAVGIASKYDVFAMLPATSIASALAAITAQNYGAGKLSRAKASVKDGLLLAFLLASGFFLWAQLSPQSMIRIFSGNEAVIAAGIPFFRTCSFDYLAVVFVFCLNGYLNGRGKTIFTMISCCFGALVLRMPITWFVYGHYPDNLTMIGTIAPAVSGFMALYTVIYVFWQFRKDEKSRG